MNKQVLTLAVNQALLSDMNARVGAVLTKGKTVLGVGHNKRNHPSVCWSKRIIHSKLSLHAEKAAILGLRGFEIRGATLYVVRVRRDGSLAIAKPCSRCKGMLNNHGVRRVFYTSEVGQWEKL